jgi:hypothetical protein
LGFEASLILLNLLVDEEPTTIIMDEGASPFEG